MTDILVRCNVCGRPMGWLRNPTRWQRIKHWFACGNYCSDDCWAEGVH